MVSALQAETPILRDVYNEHSAQGLALVAISVQETSPDDVRAYVQKYGLNYTVGFDVTSAIFHTYHAYGLPTQLFLDRNGVIRDVVLGRSTRPRSSRSSRHCWWSSRGPGGSVGTKPALDGPNTIWATVDR